MKKQEQVLGHMGHFMADRRVKGEELLSSTSGKVLFYLSSLKFPKT